MVQLSLAVVCSRRKIWLIDLSAATKVAPPESVDGGWEGNGGDGSGDVGEGGGEGSGGGGNGAGGGGECASSGGTGDGGGGERSGGGGAGARLGCGSSAHFPLSAHCSSLASPQSLLGVHHAPAWHARPSGQSAALVQAWHVTEPAATSGHEVEHQPIGLATGAHGASSSAGDDDGGGDGGGGGGGGGACGDGGGGCGDGGDLSGDAVLGGGEGCEGGWGRAGEAPHSAVVPQSTPRFAGHQACA